MKISSFRFKNIFLVLLVAGSVTLTACSPPAIKLSCEFQEVSNDLVPDTEVVVVIAPSDKFINFQSAIAAAQPKLKEILGESQSKLSIVLADGSPRLIVNRIVDTAGSLTESGRNQQMKDVLAVIDRINRCATGSGENGFAVTDESDFLDAIQRGSAIFSADSSNKQLVILGNGLQTAGSFNFKNGLPGDQQAVDAAIDQLKANNSLGSLVGVTVTWIGLGQTRVGEQQVLDENARTRLLNFWKKLIDSAGGNSDGVVAGSIGEGATATGGITTSVVPFVVTSVCIEPITVRSEDGFEFKGDSAEFKNRQLATSTATKIASQLNSANCTQGITITGYVASGGSAAGCARVAGFGTDLSLARANAFKGLLVAAGVTIKIEPMAGGLGGVDDCENGDGVEELMKQNRIAKITARQ